MIFELFDFARHVLGNNYHKCRTVTESAYVVSLSEPSLFGNTYKGRYKTAQLLIVMVGYESAGISNIIGDNGAAFGPMQIHPDTWLDTAPLRGFEYPDLFDMEQSMRAGLRILHFLRVNNLDPKYRNVQSYLYAYASGSYKGNPDAWKKIDPRCKWIGGCN